MVLLTNAPRPDPPIRVQLQSLGVPDDAYDALVTSGDVTRNVIAARPGVKRAACRRRTATCASTKGSTPGSCRKREAELDQLHRPLRRQRRRRRRTIATLFERLVARRLPMVCANPDIVVERGDRLIYCAGALARLYGELGGEAILVGKPHAPIYAAAKRSVAGARRRDACSPSATASRPTSAARSTTACRCSS